MENQRVLATLYAWCTLNGIDIDSRLEFYWDPYTGCGICSKGSHIPANTKLVHIPKHAVLSTKSCTLASYIPTSPYGRGAQLALSLALYIEILKGKFSRWSGYLQSVPRNIVDIPVFWNSDVGAGEMSRHRQKDGTDALHWLRGTEGAKILQVAGDDNKSVIDELRDYYHQVAQPLILRHKNEITRQLDTAPTLHGFFRAYSLVSSRAFVVDAYHGLCMVPVADAFNHESIHHVHLESDYHVCVECGSLHECSHDRVDSLMALATDSIRSTPRVANEDEQEDDCHMVSVTVIPPGIEVFNTYGETLTNAQLLTQYGFILGANENDVLTWDFEQVLDCVSSGADERILVHDVSNVVFAWRQLCQKDWTWVSGCGLLYLADTETTTRGYSLTLDGDGKISCQLWIIVALLSLNQTDGLSFVKDSESVLIHLRSLLDVQCRAESHLGTEAKLEDVAIDRNTYERTLLQELKQVCQLMIRLCADRKSKTGLLGFPVMGSDIGKYFDALSGDFPRTKMALSIVLSELSILDNCQATWLELQHIITHALGA